MKNKTICHSARSRGIHLDAATTRSMTTRNKHPWGIMHIRFAEADKAFIAHQVEQGLFTSETELVRAAVRDMRERRANRFYQAIQAGADDVRHGRTMPLTDALKAEIVENGIKRAEQKKPYTHCDALPGDA